MFTNITWKDFFECILFLSLAYYGVIALQYNREIKQWIQARKSRKLLQANAGPGEYESAGDAQAILYSSCIDEISAFFEEAKSRKWIREEMLYSLQRIFIKYRLLEDAPEKTAVENIASALSKEKCSVELYPNDLKRLWLG